MIGLKHKKVVRKAKNNIPLMIILWILVIAIVFIGIWVQNNLLIANETVYAVNYLPKSLVGTRIVHISDINNIDIGEAIKALNFNPDFVVISGGFKDKNGNYDISKKVVKQLADKTTVYYCYNNNDGNEDFLRDTGAINITGTTVEYVAEQKTAEQFIKEVYGDEIINKASNNDEKSVEYIEYIKEALKTSVGAKIAISGLKVPEGDNISALNFLNSVTDKIQADYHISTLSDVRLIDNISKSRMDLVLTGGTYGTNKIDNRFSKGEYNINGTEFMICGGIGTDGETARVFNFPEIQCITLSDGTIVNHNPLEKLFGAFMGDVGTIFDNDGGFKEYTYRF